MTTAKIEDAPTDRMAPARAAAARRHHEARADWLRERGWLCVAMDQKVSETWEPLGDDVRENGVLVRRTYVVTVKMVTTVPVETERRP